MILAIFHHQVQRTFVDVHSNRTRGRILDETDSETSIHASNAFLFVDLYQTPDNPAIFRDIGVYVSRSSWALDL